MPIFEPTELFARAVGGDTDIVGKEMYTFSTKRGLSLERVQEEIEDGLQEANHYRDLDLFTGPVAKLVQGLEIALKSGEVERTQEIGSRFDRLKNTFDRFEEARKIGNSADLEFLKQDLLFECWNFPLGESISLRPEATASVCRAYIEHSMQQLPQPVKLYYIGPMFRRERPQKGRYRQFYQIGAEVLGGQDAPAIDAEVIEMLMTFFDKLNLKGLELDINSIGHNAPNCRPAYVEKLREALVEVKDKLGADSQRRIDTNPLRVLDSKLDFEQPIIATLPKIADHLCDECKSHYEAVKMQLQLRGVFYRENWRLVRGLDYYMRTTFEITAKGLGSQNAVCGGGRYDGLVELLGGPPTKGIGFAIGEDRSHPLAPRTSPRIRRSTKHRDRRRSSVSAHRQSTTSHLHRMDGTQHLRHRRPRRQRSPQRRLSRRSPSHRIKIRQSPRPSRQTRRPIRPDPR